VDLIWGRIIAVDTEWAKGAPWCLSYSEEPGTAFVVMADNTPALESLNAILSLPDTLTVIHNSLYDLPVLAQMGIHPANVADTMVMAYLLQTEPQGLKPLAFRHCGMKMNSYQDTVGPYTHRKVMEYLELVRVLDWPKPDMVLEWKDGEPKAKQPQNITKKVKRLFSDIEKGKDVDPWKRWQDWQKKGDVEAVEEVLGPLSDADLSEIPLQEAVRYSARDADATLRIYPILWEKVVDMGLSDTFWRDMRALPMVVDMMQNGMPVDIQAFQELSEYFQQRLDLLQRKLQNTVGYLLEDKYVNPASYPQMGELIYDKLELHKKGGRHKAKKGKGKKSTANEILKRYLRLHPCIQDIIDWREYQKLKTTYADVVPRLAGEDGRVRGTMRITRVATGRLSCSNPNLMAQPTRSKEGKKVRDCYEAAEGRVLVSGDYSQVEMRTAANDAKDEAMLQIFWEGLDIHAQTASAMFNIPIPELDEMKHRYPAKRVGFGILYMITAEGLLRELSSAVGEGAFTLKDCEDMIAKWFGIYHGIAARMKEQGAYAKRYGYVRDMWGRLRYIPGIRSMNKWVRMEAERQAGNAPVQMGAQGIIKEAMGRLVPLYREVNHEVGPLLPLLQIHDDIVWEMEEWMVPIVVPEIKRVMEGVAPEDFIVPLKVDFKAGRKWGSMKEVEV
jgi:DNA polymerase I-like protein with 3'-5' exonuclease and polymerase domains